MRDVYIVMSHWRSNYMEDSEDKPLRVYLSPDEALKERERLEDREGNAFMSFSVVSVELV